MGMGVPKALREQVWLKKFGKVFEHKCSVTWCENILTPFKFEAGHIIPESKGGPTNIQNLLPICGSCNKSMGNRFSIKEFSDMYNREPFECFRFCMFKPSKGSTHQKSYDNDSQVSSYPAQKVVPQSQVPPDT